jgi:ligand-binding sensor domain-containing protein/signal transduction histidine kinase
MFWHLIMLVTVARSAESPPLLRLGIEKGLSNNSVRCIFQDHNGFIWIGTYDGLNRYDGSGFKIFRNRLGDSTTLPHNYIYTVHEDDEGELWVGTGQGVAILDQTNGKFSRLYFYDRRLKQLHLAGVNTNVFHTDKHGNTFVGSNGQGLLVRARGERFARQIPLVTDSGVYGEFNAQAITSVGDKVFVFLLKHGLCVYDSKRDVILPANNTLRSANCMLPDGEGNIWVGSDLGIDKFDVSTGQFTNSIRKKPGQLNAALVTSLYLSKNNDLWAGTEGGGINIIHSGNQFEYVLPGQKNSELSSESIYSIIEDKESRIWIGTLKGGINIIDPFKNRFLTISADPDNGRKLASNFIHSFCEDRNTGEILIGTDGAGIGIWNRSANSFRNYKNKNSDPSSLSHNSVTSIVQDHKGDIWLATFGGGVNRLNKESGTFRRYSCFNDSSGSIDEYAFLLYEDRARDIWVSTFWEGKLYRYNRQNDKFEVFSQQLANLISLVEDSNGQLWAGNSSSLIKIDKNNHRHAYFDIGKPVRAITEDKKGNIWLGTEGGGLILFDVKGGKIRQRFSDVNGLCNNSVLNIKEDEKGHLWLSTFNGLSRFDPEKQTFENFYQNDGLQSSQFTYNAALRLRSGELMFGGINGFNLFSPEDISVRSFMPAVMITDILINNKRLADEEDFVGKRNKTQILELHVPFSEALLSFRFDALEFSSPEKINYAYLLEGWDRIWNYSGNIRNINYNNLREGAYVLRVKSTNASGVWNNRETVLKIVVFPPWYRSWWAILIYLGAIGAMVYAFHTYRDQKNRYKYEARLSRINAENEKELNEKRVSFFTNISHEIRTPLTLIINPLKDLVEKQENPDQDELNSVYRNAKRLLSMVDHLLLFRKTETDTGQLTISRLNMYQVCREVCAFFVQLAKAKNINFSIDITCDRNAEIYGDKEKLEMILYNLVSNALKYTPDNGKVRLWFEESDHELAFKNCSISFTRFRKKGKMARQDLALECIWQSNL